MARSVRIGCIAVRAFPCRYLAFRCSLRYRDIAMKPNMQRHKMVLVRVNAGEYALARRLAELHDCNVQALVRTLIAAEARAKGVRERPTVDPRQLKLKAKETTTP